MLSHWLLEKRFVLFSNIWQLKKQNYILAELVSKFNSCFPAEESRKLSFRPQLGMKQLKHYVICSVTSKHSSCDLWAAVSVPEHKGSFPSAMKHTGNDILSHPVVGTDDFVLNGSLLCRSTRVLCVGVADTVSMCRYHQSDKQRVMWETFVTCVTV